MEPRALLSYICRSQIDGDAFVRIPKTGVLQRTLNSLPALSDRGIGHPDGDEIPIRTGVHVLDINEVPVYAENRRRTRSEKGHPIPSGRMVGLFAGLIKTAAIPSKSGIG